MATQRDDRISSIDGPRTVVEIEAATTSWPRATLADESDRVLKHGESFAIFDRWGDINHRHGRGGPLPPCRGAAPVRPAPAAWRPAAAPRLDHAAGQLAPDRRPRQPDMVIDGRSLRAEDDPPGPRSCGPARATSGSRSAISGSSRWSCRSRCESAPTSWTSSRFAACTSRSAERRSSPWSRMTESSSPTRGSTRSARDRAVLAGPT